MQTLEITKQIDIVELWKLLLHTELKEHAILYSCSMRTNYEPGEFTMVHTKEFINISGNYGNHLYIMLRDYTSSRGTIPNIHKAYIEYNGEPRKTLYSINMPARHWLELLDYIGSEALAPLRALYANCMEEVTSITID